MGSEMCIRDRGGEGLRGELLETKSGEVCGSGSDHVGMDVVDEGVPVSIDLDTCLLYTSDAADERSSVDLGGRRIIKKKKKYNKSG